METVFKKTSIQREYSVKHSSTDALSPASTPHDGVTSDSFVPHGFCSPTNPEFPKKEEKLSSVRSEDTISDFEREIQKTSDMLRNLSSEFIDDTAGAAMRYGKEVGHPGATPTQPASETNLLKSFFERSRNAHGGSVAQEFSSQQSFDERGIDEAFAAKGLLAHSTRKLAVSPARGPDSGGSSPQRERLFSGNKDAPKDVFSRYGNLTDATRRVFKPYMCLILALLALLLALFIVGLVWYLLKEKRLDDCLEGLRLPLEAFCRLKPPAIRLDLSKMEEVSNSENQEKMRYIRRALCFGDAYYLDFAINKTRTFLDSVDKSLWPTVGGLMYFKPLLLGEPIHFNVSAKEANATIQLLRLGTFENSYLPAMQKALEALEYLRNNPDHRDWIALENEFFTKTNGEKTLSSDRINTTVISYEGSPRELYWSLRLATRCQRIGEREVNYSVYQTELSYLRGKMEC